MSCQKLPGGHANRFGQFGWANHDSVAAPAQDPALDFLQTRKLKPQLHAAVPESAQHLGFVPLFFADEISHAPAEPNDDVVIALSGMNAEAIAQAPLK